MLGATTWPSIKDGVNLMDLGGWLDLPSFEGLQLQEDFSPAGVETR